MSRKAGFTNSSGTFFYVENLLKKMTCLCPANQGLTAGVSMHEVHEDLTLCLKNPTINQGLGTGSPEISLPYVLVMMHF